MAIAGNELVNPVTGHRLVFRRTAVDTKGALIEVDSFMLPGQPPPPDHEHPFQEERVQVVAGTVFVRFHDHARVLRAGDEIIIPAGTAHEVTNGGGDVAHAIVQTSPALNTEAYLETTWALARRGEANRRGMPGLLQSAVMDREFGDEIRPAGCCWAARQALHALLAPLARLLGHQPRRPYPYRYTRRPTDPRRHHALATS